MQLIALLTMVIGETRNEIMPPRGPDLRVRGIWMNFGMFFGPSSVFPTWWLRYPIARPRLSLLTLP